MILGVFVLNLPGPSVGGFSDYVKIIGARLSEKRCAEYVKKCWANGFPLKSGWKAPPLLDSTTRVVASGETGGIFMGLEMV